MTLDWLASVRHKWKSLSLSRSFASTLLPNGYAHNYSARAAIMQMHRALTNYSLALMEYLWRLKASITSSPSSSLTVPRRRRRSNDFSSPRRCRSEDVSEETSLLRFAFRCRIRLSRETQGRDDIIRVA